MGSVLRFPHQGAWESLSGAPLQGDRVVRLVYMDEAGISNVQHEPWLVVAGVVVDADKQLMALERRIASIINHYIPEHQRDGFVFHASHLFNGGGKVFDRSDSNWPLEKRLQIAAELARLPRQLGLLVAIGAVNRREFLKTFDASQWDGRDPTTAAHAIAHTVCSVHVDLWMRRNASNEVCMLIVEDNSQMRKFLTELLHSHQNPKMAPQIAGDSTKILPFRKIKASPLFEQKSQSVSLQLADFCAYVMKKSYMADVRYRDLFLELKPRIIHEVNPDTKADALAGPPLTTPTQIQRQSHPRR